jgi:hypothetical protein
MSNRFHGRQDASKKSPGQHNKGVLKADRIKKREEAEARQRNADPRKSKAFFRGSSYDPNTGKRRRWKTPDWKRHDEAVIAYLERQKVEA